MNLDPVFIKHISDCLKALKKIGQQTHKVQKQWMQKIDITIDQLDDITAEEFRRAEDSITKTNNNIDIDAYIQDTENLEN